MRKHKGMALPAAIAMCSLLLIVSFAVAGIVLEVTTISKISRVKESNEIEYANAFNTFVSEDGSIEHIARDKTRYYVYSLAETEIKALVGYKLNEEVIKFYAVYDFSSGDTLAYQVSDFYTPYKENGEGILTQYIGGIVPVPRS